MERDPPEKVEDMQVRVAANMQVRVAGNAVLAQDRRRAAHRRGPRRRRALRPRRRGGRLFFAGRHGWRTVPSPRLKLVTFDDGACEGGSGWTTKN